MLHVNQTIIIFLVPQADLDKLPDKKKLKHQLLLKNKF